MSEPSETTSQKIAVAGVVRVGDFADKLNLPVARVITELMKNGVMATINEQIDFDTASIIAADLGFEVVAEQVEAKSAATGAGDDKTELKPRPPVVAVMGHVDHGKTSLLDAIRKTDVVSGEAGGITQHIGAYQIKYKNRLVTFLDTPGHAAFSALRAHGAKMTDVAVIVVAADDGVKPQTIEAIDHARSAGIQMVIAINKVDKDGADPLRVKQELNDLGLVAEEWGGKTVMVEVSAKTGQNINQLLDLVLLVTDIEEIKARPTGPSEGVIVESHMATGKGPVATVLVQQGVLKLGDFIVTGSTYGKIRSLDDFRGQPLKQATPGTPAVISGLKIVPAFGDFFQSATSEKVAKDKVSANSRSETIKSLTKTRKIGAEDLSSVISAGQVKELNLVVKADVQGSLESLINSLGEMQNEEVAAKIVSSGVGDIGENDISFAKTAGALVLGFNVGVSATVRQLALREQVKLRMYTVIYELLDDIRDMLSGLMAPEVTETVVGELEVLKVFRTTKTQIICGGKVANGKVEPNLKLHITRAKEVIGEGEVTSVKKEQQAVKEAVEGELCGLSISTTTKIAEGDRLQFYVTETKARSL